MSFSQRTGKLILMALLCTFLVPSFAKANYYGPPLGHWSNRVYVGRDLSNLPQSTQAAAASGVPVRHEIGQWRLAGNQLVYVETGWQWYRYKYEYSPGWGGSWSWYREQYNCNDRDQDGYARQGGFCGEMDCDDYSRNTYPGAPELRGDNKDNNCNGEVDEGCCRIDIQLNRYSYEVNVGSGGEATIGGSVFEGSGKPVRWTLDIAGKTFQGTGGNVNARWNGLNLDGKVEEGTYPGTLYVETVDGECEATETFTITVSKTDDCKLLVTVGSAASVASGELTDSLSLFSIPGGINLSLNYSSYDAHNTLLGTGWSHSYDIFLVEHANGDVSLREGNANINLFEKSGSGFSSPVGVYGNLSRDADSMYLLTKPNGTIYSFGANSKISSIKDRNGAGPLFIYGAQGQLVGIEADGGQQVAFAYDGNGKLVQVSDPTGNAYSFSVGTTLNSVTFPDGSTTGYNYEGNAFLVAKTDPSGNLTTYNYDDNYRVVSSTDPMGRVRTIEYPEGEETVRSTSFTEKDGSVWQYRYDTQRGDLLEKTDPQGGSTSYTYDAMHNLLSKTDPAGTTAYTYDDKGNMLTVTDVAGHKTEYSHNEFGQVTSTANAAGETTVYAYDSRGNLTKVTDPQGNSTTYQYDEQGRLTSTTNAGGLTTSLGYDDQGNVESLTGADGTVTIFTYDANGNRSSVTDGQGNTTRYEYDVRGQLIKAIDANGQSTFYQYDANGNRSSVTDANGKTTTFEYDFEGQMTSMTDAMGYTTSFTYGGSAGCYSCGGGVDKLTKLTDAKGQSTLFKYDPLGNLIRETDPQGHRTEYDYDAAERVASKTDPNGNTIRYSYDTLGRLVAKAYPDGKQATFSYDAEGNLLSAQNQNIAYGFTYDPSDRLASVADSSGTQIDYTYDASGNRTSLSSSSGIDISCQYDDLGRLAQIGSQAGNIAFGYDDLGRRGNLIFPNGVATTYTYDDLGRLTDLLTATGSSIIAKNNYTHDAVGNRMSNQDARNTTNYTYDDIYRLTVAESNTPGNSPGKGNVTGKGTSNATDHQREFYSYDQVGNRTASSEHSAYSHNSGNELLSADAATYAYDANGNRTSKTTPSGTTTYSWDYENRLTQVVIPSGQAVSFTYDPFGRRVSKTVGDIVTTYTYDSEDILFETSNGELGNIYIHGPGIDEPLALVGKKGTSYYHADGLGSIVAMTDGLARNVQQYEYDSFGNQHDMKNRIKQPYGYTGREHDRETGLRYYRARYYDGEVGRFISEDPIGFKSGDTNLYAYVGNDAINNIDPSGLASYKTVEAHAVVGAGLLEVECCTENNEGRKHLYVKICMGAAVEVSGGVGEAFNSDGESCSAPPESLFGGELGASYIIGAEVGMSVDTGGSGVSGTGGAGLGAGKIGVGAKATACYYQLINTISSDAECCE
jgi:RHS repeat-associated protein